MINTARFSKYRNDEHIQFVKDILYICEQSNPVTLKVEEQFKKLKKNLELLETAYLQIRGSELTSKIQAEDDVRDNLIIGIEKVADGYTHHYKEQNVDAAKRLLIHIKKYGNNIARMNYQAETTALNDIIDFTKTDTKLKAAVSLLGLTEWFTKLEESNIKFNDLYMVRITEKAAQPKLNLKEVRQESTILYQNLVLHISSHATINPSKLYTSTINKFNELIDKYNGIRK